MKAFLRDNRWTVTLLVANLALVWLLPLIPAQDLPQHLTYIRIFADYGSPDLLFKDFYTLPTGFQPYDTIYLLLAWTARHTSVLFALRLILSLYVVLVFVGFDIIAAACHGRTGKRVLQSTVLASMTIWGSAFAMGFLQYFLCVPLVMITVGTMVWGCDEEAPDWVGWAVIPAAMAVASIHLVAAGALCVFAVLYVLMSVRQPGTPRRLEVACRVIGTVGLTLIAWHYVGGEVLGAKPRGTPFAEAWRNAQGFEFVNTLLQTTWYDPPVTFNYLSWAVIGPYRIIGLAVGAAAVALCLWQVIPFYKKGLPDGRTGELRLYGQQYARAAWAFALFACLLPWGINVPSEVTYLNFRIISLAFALLLPLVPPRWFEIPKAKRALVGMAVVFFLNFTVHAVGFNHEAKAPIHLLARVPNKEVVLSLVFRSRSSYFAKGFRLTHFLPMYFTILDGGICSQFWAKYTEHLPIDYRPGKRIAQPDDWSPQNFDETKHLRDSDWVLLQRATPDDPRGAQNDAIRAEQKLNTRADLVACEDVWCLYHVRQHI